MNNPDFIYTTDKVIRSAFIKTLEEGLVDYKNFRIIEEFGITNEGARVDIAVVNGVLHGYELKSDMDTLLRLPDQMKAYNAVLDQITLVVGKNHLFDAMKIVPDWWGITVAKITGTEGIVSFYKIREPEQNPIQDSFAVATLLWKDEALGILEEMDQARGVRSKNKSFVYERLSKVLDEQTLKTKVREHLCTRINWRSDLQFAINGD